MGLARRRARWVACAAAGAFVLLTAACGPAEDKPEKPGASASKSPTEPPIDNAADPAHAVAAPGPFAGRLYGDDLLVVAADTIPDDLLAEIEAIKIGKGKDQRKGVTAAEPLSVASFTVENKSYRIAAVDAGGYRAFTGQASAEWQDQWDRIAGGEIAIRKTLDGRITLAKDDYLEVGSGESTNKIHLGAWSPAEVDTIDAMVNAKWGDTLGMPERNALIINTGLASPQEVRKQIEKLADLSVTALDIVAQTGIDPDTYQTVSFVGTFAEAVGIFRYTPIGGGRVQPEASWVKSHVVTEDVPIIGRMTCNRYMMPQLKAALAEVQRLGLADKIHPGEYAGCYYPRFIAGSTTLSNHSYGLAFDINVPGNQRGTVGQMDRGVVAIFKRWGFAWGGDWGYTDPMHFELDRLVKPGS